MSLVVKKLYSQTMKHFFLLVLFTVANCYAAHVAVLETIQTDGNLDIRECQFLTDKLRQMAVMTLPNSDGWTIMTRENIRMMLPPGKSLEECEGICLVETGKNIAADYVVQGRVSHFDTLHTITVELYETATGKLTSSIAVKSETAVGLLDEIEAHGKSLFLAIKNAPKKNVENAPSSSENAAITEIVADKAEDSDNIANLDNSVEKTGDTYKVIHSFNFVMPYECNSRDFHDGGGGCILGAEINWSRYIVAETGIPTVLSLTFGYNYLGFYHGLNFDLKYGWGVAPFRDKFFLAFYGIVGLDAKYLFRRWGDEPNHRYDYSILLGGKITVGHQISDRFGLMAGINVTADMWGQAIYENTKTTECMLAGINVELLLGMSVAF